MANKFWIGGTGNWDGTTATNAHWSNTTGPGTPGATGPGVADVAIFDGNSGGGTVTVTGNIVMQGLTTSAFTGTLDFAANDNSITLTTTWTDAATGVHTIHMGDGTWTFRNATTGPITITASANLTLNCNNSIVALAPLTTALAVDCRWGGKTFNVVQIQQAGTYSFSASGVTFNGAVTIVPGVAIQLSPALAFIFNAAQTWAGTRALPIVLTSSNFATAAASISCPSGAFTLNWGILTKVTAGGGATFTATNTVGYSTTTGWAITGPVGVPPALGIGI